MQISDLLKPDRVLSAVKASSKKRTLEILSELIAKSSPDLNAHEVFESLIARERLGSTGLGSGVALPHGRVKGSRLTIGAFVQLQEPVSFDAIDSQPVDLLFALVVPEESTEEHLQALAALAEMFIRPELRQRLRSLRDPVALYECLVNWKPSGG